MGLGCCGTNVGRENLIASELKIHSERAKNSLAGQTMSFLFGTVFPLNVGLPPQIYVERVPDAREPGVFGLLEGGSDLLAGLVGFGLESTVAKFIRHHLALKQFQLIRQLIKRGALVLLMCGLILYILLAMQLNWIIGKWPEIQQYQTAALLIATGNPLGLILFYPQQGLGAFLEIQHMVIGSAFVQSTVEVGYTAFLSVEPTFFGYDARL